MTNSISMICAVKNKMVKGMGRIKRVAIWPSPVAMDTYERQHRKWIEHHEDDLNRHDRQQVQHAVLVE
jgi:hypothetical protein